MKETALSSRPQETENSRQYLLLRTDIVKKTVVVCPWNFISRASIWQKHMHDHLQRSRNTYLIFAFVFCFPVYKRLYRSSYLTLSLVELLPILREYSAKEGDIIRKFSVMKRNLERVTHVEQKLIESSLILHQEVRTSRTSYSLLVSFFQICPQLGSMNFRWLVSCLLDFKQNGSFLIKARYNWSNTVDFLISF